MGRSSPPESGAFHDPQQQLDELFRQHYKPIYKFVFWMVQDRGIAEDLTQETFLKAYFAQGQLQNGSNASSWLHLIARNLCIDYWRKSRRKIEELNLYYPLPEHIAAADNVSSSLENKEIRSITWRALGTLKAEHRTALLLREREEMTYEEAASIMGISVAAFTSLLSRARERFANVFFAMAYPRFKDHCFGPKEYGTLLKWIESLDDPGVAKRSIIERTRTFFDNNVENFDRRRERHYPRPLFDILSAEIDFTPDMVAADLGTATGSIAEKLGHRLRKVYALDLSPLMLEAAANRFERSGLHNIEGMESDVTQILLPDGSVDLAYGILLLHHLFDPEDSIKEIARTLRKGGKVLFADFGAHDFAWLREENADVWSGFKPEQLAGWLRKAGLEKVWAKKLVDPCFYYPDKNARVPLIIAGATKTV